MSGVSLETYLPSRLEVCTTTSFVVLIPLGMASLGFCDSFFGTGPRGGRGIARGRHLGDSVSQGLELGFQLCCGGHLLAQLFLSPIG